MHGLHMTALLLRALSGSVLYNLTARTVGAASPGLTGSQTVGIVIEMAVGILRIETMVIKRVEGHQWAACVRTPSSISGGPFHSCELRTKGQIVNDYVVDGLAVQVLNHDS